MDSTKIADTPYPPQVGENVASTNGNSPKSKVRKVVSNKPKPDSLEALRKTEEELSLCRKQLEELHATLAASEKQRAELFMDLPVPMYATDAEGTITHFNQAAADLWGRAPDIGKDKFNIAFKIYDADGNLLPESRIPVSIAIREKRTIKNAEVILEREDGTRRNILSNPQPIYNSEGIVLACVNTLVDITERKKAEDSIKKSEATLRTILENTKDSYVLYNKKGIVLAYNEAAREQYLSIHGTHLQQGKSVYEMTPPERHDLAREVFRRCFQGETFELKVNRVSHNGMDRWFKSSYHPIKSASGEVIAASVKSSEITDEVRIQSAIAKSEANLKALFDNSRDAYVLVDMDEKIIAFNHVTNILYRQVHGKELGSGVSIYDILPPERKAETQRDIKRALQGESVESKTVRRGLDGKNIWLRGFFNPVKSPEGEIIGVCISVSNISDEVQAETVIRESEANLRALFDNAKDGFVLLSTDGKILTFNHPAETLYRKMYGKELQVGKYAGEVLGTQIGEYVKTAFMKVLAGKSVERKSKQVATDRKEYWLRGYYNPVKSPDGNIIGICMGISDITTETEANAHASQLAAIVNSSEDAVIGKTLQGIVTSWNPGAEKIFGYDAAEMIGQSITKLIPPNRLEEEDEILRHLRNGEVVDHYETIRLTKKGIPLNISLTISPIRDTDGTITGASKIARDITKQKLLQDQLHQTELNFREELEKKVRDRTIELNEKNEELTQQKEFMETVLDSSIDQICVYDREFRFIGANKVFSHVSGIKAHEILGRTFLEVFPSLEHSPIFHAIQKTLSTNKSETINWRSDDTGRFYSIYVIPLTQKNSVYGVIVIAHDNTTIIEASEKLEKFNQTLEEKNLALQEKNDELSAQKEFIETVIDSSVDYITVYDTETRVMTMNKQTEKLLNYKRGEAIGKTFLELFPNTENTETHTSLLKTLTGESTHHILPKGEMGHAFDIYSIPLKHHGKVYAALVLVHDITEILNVSEQLRATNEILEEKNTELERSNTELERFAYVASHDLQEPLRKIQMFAGRIRENNKDRMDEASQNYFKRIDASSQRMSSLIKDILNYSRLNTSAQSFESADLAHSVKRTLSDFDLLIEEKKAMVSIDALPVIEGIPAQLDQLFHNLIGNALKFSKEGVIPRIEISSRKLSPEKIREQKLDNANSYWEISVKDNGIGFDQEFAEKIFVIFQRLNERTKYEGTGIGLALCRKIVDNHNGVIYAESHEGEGSEFHIILPEKQKKI